MSLLFGPAFEQAGPILRLLAILVPLAFINTYMVSLLVAYKANRLVLNATVLNLIITVVACLILIPTSGPLGAAAARIIGDTSEAAFMLYHIRAYTAHAADIRL